MAEIKKINHVAIAVEDIAEALSFWRDKIGLKLDHIEEVPEQKAKVAFIPVGESKIELVEPTDEYSGTARFMNSRGPGLHHICLEVDDILEMTEGLKEKGVRLIDEAPIEIDDRWISFIHPKSTGGVLVELYQIKK